MGGKNGIGIQNTYPLQLTPLAFIKHILVKRIKFMIIYLQHDQETQTSVI